MSTASSVRPRPPSTITNTERSCATTHTIKKGLSICQPLLARSKTTLVGRLTEGGRRSAAGGARLGASPGEVH